MTTADIILALRKLGRHYRDVDLDINKDGKITLCVSPFGSIYDPKFLQYTPEQFDQFVLESSASKEASF